jgi:large-conductance mechanosensitive channel
MKDQIVATPEDLVSDSINNIFTYINYFLVAALVVLLIYMTIRDFKKKKTQKQLDKEREEYAKNGDEN